MNNGPKVKNEGLVLALDAASTRSTSKSDQKFNLLPDAGNWTTGTGSQTGYSTNGSSSEQNRLLVSDDPWGRSSVTWRTTPDSTSGADGGWNTSFYSCDRTKTYRMSIWVRRYTSGTGGTFYFGLHFSPTNTPMRVDNGSLQGNPYFNYPAQSSLELDQWYLVVYHVHPYGYDRTKGDHPDSGWYKNGKKISTPSTGNTGGDVVFLSDTTSIRHRTYHYYTTNTSSGLEFADPRIELLTPKTPKVRHLIKKGASGWKDLKSKTNYNIPAGMQFTGYDKQSSFDFDGTNDYVQVGTHEPFTLSNRTATWEAVVKFDSTSANAAVITRWENGVGETWWFGRYSSARIHLALRISGGYYPLFSSSSINSTSKYYHMTAVLNGTSVKFFIDGELDNTTSVTAGSWSNNTGTLPNTTIGAQNDGGANLLNGQIPLVKLYDRALTADEVKQNFNAYRKRFNL